MSNTFEHATFPIGVFILWAGKIHIRDKFDRVWCIEYNHRKDDNPIEVIEIQ